MTQEVKKVKKVAESLKIDEMKTDLINEIRTDLDIGDAKKKKRKWRQ